MTGGTIFVMKRLLQIVALFAGLVVAWQYLAPRADDSPPAPASSVTLPSTDPVWSRPTEEERPRPAVAHAAEGAVPTDGDFDEAAAQLAAEPALIDALEDAASPDPKVREDAERFLAEHEARTR